MSNAGGRPMPSAAYLQQAQRLKSFRSLLDPTDLLPGHNVADLYSLRHLCLQGGGIPDTASTSSDGWLRAQAWRVLLGYLTPEKSEWDQLLEKRRAEYYQFVCDFLPQDGGSSNQEIPGKLSERDALLDLIYRDLARSRKNAFAFYREEIKSSRSCPLAPLPLDSSSPLEPRIPSRHSLLKRLETINADFAQTMMEERMGGNSAQARATHSPQKNSSVRSPRAQNRETAASRLEPDGPAITLQPASPQSKGVATPDVSSTGSDGESYFASADEGETEVDSNKEGDKGYIDRRWQSMLRILYIYALLNPSTGYVQGMNEVLFVLLYVMGTTGHLPSVTKMQEGGTEQTNDGDDTAEDPYRHSSDMASSFHYLDMQDDPPGAHAEADAFWCFSALVGDIRDLYDFDGMENAGIKVINRKHAEMGHKQVTGMAEALKKFSLRLKWLDEALWQQLRSHSLDPRLPYYSFRWLACMISTELTLPSVVRIWDAILAESGGSSTSEGSGTTPKVEFLIDVCCALLTNVRGALLVALEESRSVDEEDAGGDDSFGRAMNVLQGYPDDDVGPIIEVACLYRQKRLAAPLTGDGPPSEDEDESLLSVRERAAQALRTWTNSTTPSRTTKWLASASPRTPSTTLQTEGLTPTRSASATLFQRYSDAIQSSDTAANWSKASTNFTAKAMATWSGTKSGKDGQQSSPLADFKTSFVNRVMSGSSPSTEVKQVHPSLRWSVQSMPPELPLPNVNDSPPQSRRDSLFSQSPLRGYIPITRLGGQNNDNGLKSPDLSSHTSSTPVTSPTSMSFGRSNVHETGKRANGPKPLLLTKSARPPREASANGTLSVDEPMSRKVSSGPLAISPSSNIRRKINGSGSRRDSSYGGSVTSSQADRDSPSNDGIDESSVSTKSESVHALPSIQAAKDWLPPIPSSVAPVGLQGSGHGTGQGTVPASAFAKVRMASKDQDNKHTGMDEMNRPAFGQVASSGNVPLASKVTLQRKPIRKDSEPSGLASPIAELQERPPSDGFSNRDSVGSSSSLRRYRMSSYMAQTNSIAADETRDTEVQQKYTLTDEAPAATSTKSPPPNRTTSSSSNKSGGIGRRQRAQSGGKRSRRSIINVSSNEDAESSDLMDRGGRGSLKLGSIDPGVAVAAPGILPPKRFEAEKGRLLPAEELLSRLQLDQGYSGGESSGFEDESHNPSSSIGHRDASSEDFHRHDDLGPFRLKGRGEQQEWHEGYTTADMAAIGSALAFADGADDDESGE